MTTHLPPSEPFKIALNNAHAAMRRKDNRAAHHFAQQAREIDPTREEPWLIMAAVASPAGSLYYLQEALRVNPDSDAARKGIAWALKRLPPVTLPEPEPEPLRAQVTPRRTIPTLSGVMIAMLVLAAGLWLYRSAGQAAQQVAQFWQSPAQLAPTGSPASQVSFTNTIIHTPTPSRPRVATATPPAPPQENPEPVPAVEVAEPAHEQARPSTNYTVQRGDTLLAIALQFDIEVQEIISANAIANPSQIGAGQQLIIPGAGDSAGNSGGEARQSDASPASAVPAPPAQAGKIILVDISDQQLYAYTDGALTHQFTVSTGRANSTPLGRFQIRAKEDSAWSNIWAFWMPDWMGFSYYANGAENGFHALPVSSSGKTLWEDQIGAPVSYGCVVLLPQDSIQLYQWAEVGTPVEIQP